MRTGRLWEAENGEVVSGTSLVRASSPVTYSRPALPNPDRLQWGHGDKATHHWVTALGVCDEDKPISMCVNIVNYVTAWGTEGWGQNMG